MGKYDIKSYLKDKDKSETNFAMDLAKKYSIVDNPKNNEKKDISSNYLEFTKKYEVKYSPIKLIFSNNIWDDLILNSIINIEQCKKELDNSPYFNKNIPIWQKLVNFNDLEDKEFDKLLADVYKNFSRKYCENINQYKFISSMLLFFYEENFFNIDFKELDKKIKEGLDSVYKIQTNKLKKYIFKEIVAFEDSSYESFTYFTSEKFNHLNNYINKYFDEKRIDILKKDSSLIVESIIDRNTDNLLKLLESSKYDEEISYYNKEIFLYMDLDELFNALIKTNNNTLHFFGSIIKDRYFKGREDLFKEKEFLTQLLSKIDAYLKSSTNKLSSYNIKKGVKLNLEIAIERIGILEKDNTSIVSK